MWYGLVGMARYMVWSSGRSMVYGVVWQARHGMARWASHGIYVLAWRGVAWHMLLSGGVWHGMACQA